ncbi:DUF397 domain-containing protein [Nocardiopsis xinjiangensis]|uniref:DUF397 domain-containing protein n=1 Tax=Nocardiopsis xinjiangensis TaxID=124285 RepID=UPI000A007C63|nr:DUF397 domain-containing protein [Nocardiopsis xinjiangensis]
MLQLFKSSYSGGDNNCVEVARLPDQMWHKASYSVERGEFMKVSQGPMTGVRDTKHRELGTLFFAADEWQAFPGTARNDLSWS